MHSLLRHAFPKAKWWLHSYLLHRLFLFMQDLLQGFTFGNVLCKDQAVTYFTKLQISIVVQLVAS